MKKKLLIIGGSGLLGINWAYIVRDDFEVILALHNRNISLDGVEAEKISIESIESLFEDLSRIMPDIVVNAASITSVEECEKNFNNAKEVNTDAASNIAIVCEELNIKLVHISTDHIFSGKNQFSDEYCEASPLNNYARTKYQAEIEVKNSNPSSLIIRTNFYGWGTSYRHSFSDLIINNLRNNLQVHLFADVFFTPMLIDELVSSINELIGLNQCGIFNVVGSDRLSKFEFGLKVADCFGLNPSLIKSINYREKLEVVRPRDMSLSNAKLLETLNRQVPNLSHQLDKLKRQEGYRVIL